MNKNLNNPIVKKVLAILFAISLIANLLQFYQHHLKSQEIIMESQIKNGTFIEKNCLGVMLPDCTVYLDKRMDCYEGLELRNDLNWLYNCKLYKDFGWYPNAYLVYTSINFIRRNDDKSSDTFRNAYFQTSRWNDDKYIFIWEATDPSIIHELAHFADVTHNNISQSKEWAAIYEKEWTQNTWLTNYKREGLGENEQLSLYLKESFAEAFTQWYCDYHKDNFIKNCPSEELEDLIFHTVKASPIGVNRDTYPMTYEYMQDFYENYEFNDMFLEALSNDYTSLD